MAAMAACSGDDPEVESSSAETTETTAPTPTFVGDGSAFCDAMLGIGQIDRPPGSTPEDVLEGNAQLAAIVEEALATVPEDAPADVDALLADYLTATEAIAAAGGDVDAAFATLEVQSPGVVDRLGSSSSHQEGYDFLIDRCGISAP